jgi:hypothetical protein
VWSSGDGWPADIGIGWFGFVLNFFLLVSIYLPLPSLSSPVIFLLCFCFAFLFVRKGIGVARFRWNSYLASDTWVHVLMPTIVSTDVLESYKIPKIARTCFLSGTSTTVQRSTLTDMHRS